MMLMFDDSALLHEAEYDPAKAHEYYLRVRKLKGRQKKSDDDQGKDSSGSKATSKVQSKKKPQNASERRKDTDAKVAALKSRLLELQGKLSQLISKSKGKSSSKATGGSSGSKTEKAKVTAKRNASEKSRKPLTAKQKREQSARSKEYYEKNKKTPRAQEIAKVRAQIKAIRAQLKAALAEAQQKASKEREK
jgi:hypothetical protein